ncbi:MAG: response regulator [Acidobacteriota bacterium]
MTQRIVLVEDDGDIAEILRVNLAREGYSLDVFTRGDSALAAVRSLPPDLVLLDLMLPGLDGLELCRMLKRDAKTSAVPLIMLTAKGTETDRIVGLELGADDYIAKPFSPREVILRIKSVLRRKTDDENNGDVLRAGQIEISLGSHSLRVAGEEVPLTATEFKLLHFLMQRAGRVQTRNVLLTEVWAYSEGVDSRTVDTHVRRLRRKLGVDADRIETLVGVGYRFRP